MTSHCRNLLIAGIVIVSTTVPTSAEEVRLRRLPDGTVAAPVQVSGKNLWMLLDTGSTRSFLRRSVARRLGLKPQQIRQLETPMGTVKVACSPLTIRLGSRDLHLERVGWNETSDELAGWGSVDGILGMDALAQGPLMLDTKGRWLSFDRDNHQGGHVIELGFLAGRPSLRLPVRILNRSRNAHMTLVVDSGATSFILFGTAARTAHRSTRFRTSKVRLASLAGTRLALQVPHSTIGNDLSVRGPVLLPEVVNRSEDGLLPIDGLSPIYFDWANRRAFVRMQRAR